MTCEKCGKPKTEVGATYSFNDVYEKYCICHLKFKRLLASTEAEASKANDQDDLVRALSGINNLIT